MIKISGEQRGTLSVMASCLNWGCDKKHNSGCVSEGSELARQLSWVTVGRCKGSKE